MPGREAAAGRKRGRVAKGGVGATSYLLITFFRTYPPSPPPPRLLADETLGHFFEAETLPKHKAIVTKFLAQVGERERACFFVSALILIPSALATTNAHPTHPTHRPLAAPPSTKAATWWTPTSAWSAWSTRATS